MKKSNNEIDLGSKDNALHRAAKQISTPELSYGFDIHLARKLNKQARRVQRRQKITSILCNIVGIIAMIALMVTATKKLFKTIDIKFEFSMLTIDFAIPKSNLILSIAILSIGLILMLLIDSYLRQRFYRKRFEEALDAKRKL